MRSWFIQLLCVIATLSVVTTSYADHHLQLGDELKPLQFLVGEWVLEFEGNDGVMHKITTSSKPDAGGHVLRTSGQWHRDGELRVSWFTLRYAEGDSGGIKTMNIISNGSKSEGSTALRDGTLVSEFEGNSPNGDKMSYETHIKMLDEDTFTSQRVNIVVNGEARNDWPVGTYKRVK